MYPYLGYNDGRITKECILDIYKVVLSRDAKRDLLKVPLHIVRKLQGWVDDIEYSGLCKTRKIPGYHDELLKGKRLGQRSIRLSKSYRAIYILDHENKIEIVKVLEVNKHDY
jgi:proteic killer suppression protein